MSKEERTEEQVAKKLGFNLITWNEERTRLVLSRRGSFWCIEGHSLDMWKLLLAAETKLEPQTVAEPTAREWREANGFPVTHWRQHPGENLVENNFHLTPEQFDEALTAFAHIHSPAPDTKGMAEQIAKRVESWATGSNTHVSTVFAIARDIRNAYGLPTDTPTEAK